jgi:hypothetical protein
MVYPTLLTLHILAGAAGLVSLVVATLTKTLDIAHEWHVYSGTAFFWSMTAIFLTAVPMTLLRPNLFLFLIAILSFYFALAGWRYAKNRRGRPRALDWVSAGLMAVTSLVMVTFGIVLLVRGDPDGVTILVFGGIGGALSLGDLRTSRQGGARGPERIAKHLTMMLAGSIAAITAFVVTNFTMQPRVVLWLAPTIVITPLIVWWNTKIRTGKRPMGMPEADSS